MPEKFKNFSLVLVAGSTTARSVIKKIVFRENLIPYQCSECGLGDSWADQKLSLVLDHRNGVSNDHRLSNLRFLCPNCNSQQSTFSGRNKKVIRKPHHCACGAKVHKTSSKCISCAALAREVIMWPGREELASLVGEMSFVDVGRRLGVSDVSVRRRCLSLGILSL
jgi:hypothetical protein